MTMKTRQLKPMKCSKSSSKRELVQFTQWCLTLCDPREYSTPGLPVHHQLMEFTQTHVHWVSDAIQPSHPLSSPSPPTANTLYPLSHQRGPTVYQIAEKISKTVLPAHSEAGSGLNLLAQIMWYKMYIYIWHLKWINAIRVKSAKILNHYAARLKLILLYPWN